MQSLVRSSALLRSCVRGSEITAQYTRSLSSLPNNNELIDDHDSSVLVEGRTSSRTAILNRPSNLNAINTSMAYRLQKLYKSWEENRDIGFVVMKGSGRAFCAGGDIVSVYHMINKGHLEEGKEFFWEAYNLIYLIGTYMKPHLMQNSDIGIDFLAPIQSYHQVALLNGITMGGGAGVSMPSLIRVATDKTVFATPETLIGFHPDAGASFHLSHLPGYLGEYLALTGDRLSGVEMMACGLATHYSLSENLPLIEEQLGQLVTNDPSVIETALEKYSDLDCPDNTSVLGRIDTLDKCFSHDTVEEIIDALECEAAKTHDEWCFSTLKKLKHASPLSLKVSLRSIREGRFQTLDQCLIREYRMTLQAIYKQISNDFCEGIRAQVLDKDFAPKWDPPSLAHVSQDMVDQYFSPLTALEPELELPIQEREAFT